MGKAKGFHNALFLEVCLPTEERASNLERVLEPEVSEEYWERSSVEMKRNKKVLTLTIRARDVIALRAVVNSFLRWIANSLELMDISERR